MSPIRRKLPWMRATCECAICQTEFGALFVEGERTVECPQCGYDNAAPIDAEVVSESEVARLRLDDRLGKNRG